MTGMAGIDIRPARPGDEGLILGFIRELADYERLASEVVAGEPDIARTLFGDAPVARCLIASRGGEPVGFALYFRNYSTFLGRAGIYLEDLFVRPAARGAGVGRALLAAVAQVAVSEGAGRLEWSVLDWNRPAIDFYRKMGARAMAGWTVHRLTGGALRRLARAARGITLTMVVAAGRNGIIGRNGELPWKLSADLRRFKSLTLGKPVIMGRRTFDAIGRPLPGRANIVVTRQEGFAPTGVTVARDPLAAVRLAEELIAASAPGAIGANEICVIGGGEIYASLCADVDRVHLTIVDDAPDGDAAMPSLVPAEWRGEMAGEAAADDRNERRVWFVDLQRV